MPSSLADYLAKNYLTADPGTERPKKKRRKAQKSAPDDVNAGGLIIADDDPPDLRAAAAAAGNEDEEDGPVMTGTRSAEFRRAKSSGWKTVGSASTAGAGTETGTGTGEKDAADAILASAAAERSAHNGAGEDEDAPMIEAADADADADAPRMETGARAGLQTAEQTAAMVADQERRRKAEAALYKKKPDSEGQETIYRDASGRIINVAMKRAEARKAEEAKREKEEAAREALLGDVQRQDRDARRQQLQEAKTMPVARTVEDESMNEDMKSQQRWNDPAAGFLTKPTGGGISGTGKPLYRGSFQPNRYGIRPGHRWDGVDRGNGFEKEWFASRNRKGRIESLEYQWLMDE